MIIFDLYNKFSITYNQFSIAYKNTIFIIWKRYRKKEFIPVILKDGSKRRWPFHWILSYATIFELSQKKAETLKQLYDSIEKSETNNSNKDEIGEFIEFKYKNHRCRFYGIIEKKRIINGAIEEVFFAEDYKFINPERSIVIDIGANIGDSSIYFCLNNAERVIALEPFSFPYKYANINVIANKMNDKIELLNAGYGVDKKVTIKDKKSTVSDIIEVSDGGEDNEKINTYSLGTLLNMYSLNNKDNLLLKMDCEGCEYNLLNEPIEVLRKFKRIQIEFHYGYKNLESKLEVAGFSVHHSKPLKSPLNERSLRKMALINKDFTFGMIYAERLQIK